MLRVPNRRIAFLSKLLPAGPDPAPPLTPAEQRELVAAYFYPDFDAPAHPIDNPITGEWQKMCDVAKPGSIIIANHESGTASVKDPKYEVAIKYGQDRGYKVVSYVGTRWGEKPRDELATQAKNQMEWYKPDGIFLDEMVYTPEQDVPTGGTARSYYKAISKIIRSGPRNRDGSVKMVIGNPGNVNEEQGDWGLRRPRFPFWPFSKYPVLDILVAFENTAAEYKTWVQPSWLYPGTNRAHAYRFAHMVHSAKSIPVSEEDAITELSRQRHAGYVYVTTEKAGTDPTDPGGDMGIWNMLAPSWFSRFGPLPLPPVQ